jgi:hypothetical protein
MARVRTSTAAASFVLVLAPLVRATQDVPFFSAEEWGWLAGEVSGDRSYEHIRVLTMYHRPFASEGLMAAARYVEEKAKAYGLEDVRLVVQPNDPDEGMEWTARRGELWMLEPEIARLCDMDSVQTSLADRSRPCDVTAEIVDVGEGRPADFEGKEIEGRIPLTTGSFGSAFEEGVWKRGALGVITYPGAERSVDRPDQVRWTSIPASGPDGKKGTFGFVLSRRAGLDLARRLRRGPVRARAIVEADIVEPGWLVFVDGRIRGSDPSLPEVVYTGHLQEERTSANDDASGCANTLEVARALARSVAEKRLPRPRRSIRFWWTTEISSEYRYFSEHPEEVARVLCDVNQDMVGAFQDDSTMRAQNVTRLPWARAHVLEDVVEEVVGALVAGNTSDLASSRGAFSPYTKPVLAQRGSRHRYAARLIPFHNSTDHQCFTAPPIGKPGFTFTNWPDEFIHSSDDDLSRIDPTQLQRNALAAAAIGFTMARASRDGALELASLASGNALARLGRELRVAMGLLTDRRSAHSPGERLKRARAQLRVARDKEKRALASIADVTGCDPNLLEHFVAEIDHYYEHADELVVRTAIDLAGGVAPEETPTAAELDLAAIRPRLAGTVADYFERRRNVRGDFDLSGLMQWEVLSFVDGERTGLEVYESTAGEARSAGEWYYGKVEPESVLAFLRACEEAKVVESVRTE